MKKPKTSKYVISALIAITIISIAVTSKVYTDWEYICENTGSRRGHREWHMGFNFKTGDWYKKSRLEEFMETTYPADLTHRWTSYAGTGRNILGKSQSFGHGRPGPILSVKYDIFNQYVSHIDNKKKRSLYDILASEDRQRIEDEISIIWETFFDSNDAGNISDK